MLDVLRSYLSEAATPELKAALEQSQELFERIELPEFESGYEELLATDGEVEHGATLPAIVELTRELQQKILVDHGIRLTNEATVAVLNQVIEGVLDLPDYEDTDAMVQLCNMEVPAQEVFAELMALVTTLSTEEVLVYVDSVDQALIDAIRQHARTFSNEVINAAAEGYSVHVERLTQFCELIGTRDLSVLDGVKMGLRLGLPFVTYADMVGRELETMSVDKASYELVAMALASSDGTNNPKTVIKDNLEHYISSIDMITKIDVKVTDILLGLQR